MEVKIIYGAFFFFLGWLWFYLFLRQFIFNFTVAFPLIRKMRSIDRELISASALKYTWVSVAACLVFSGISIAVIVFVCKLYMQILFALGAIVALFSFFKKIVPENKQMFDSFCNSYYRFISDDELRTSIYNKDTHRMKMRMKAMGLAWDFIPQIKAE